MLTLFAALAALAAVAGQAPAPGAERYAEGQVWEYRTRPGEEESLLLIQRIEAVPAFAERGPVYHVSLVGVRFGGPDGPTTLPHLPVSRETLDSSVVRLSERRPDFPNPEEGIAVWRQAQGGVFTIPLAEIVAIAERAMQEVMAPADE